MSLDLFAIDPPVGGLFLFGKRPLPQRDDSATSSGEKGGKTQPGSAPRPDRQIPFNPYAQALRHLARIEHQRQVLAPLFTSGARKGLGALIDLRA